MVELRKPAQTAGDEGLWIMDSLLEWPAWWSWELELTSHLLKRMIDRQFNEIDLRTMLTEAVGYSPELDGRFSVHTRHEDQLWEVIVEPDYDDHVLLVVTTYPRH
jgi:hypothetical protein